MMQFSVLNLVQASMLAERPILSERSFMQQWRKTYLSFRQLAGCGLQSLPVDTLYFKPQKGGKTWDLQALLQ